MKRLIVTFQWRAFSQRLIQTLPNFTKAIELDPNDALAYYNRGLVHKLLGKKAEAIADFEKCIQLSQDPSLIQAAKHEIEELQSR